MVATMYPPAWYLDPTSRHELRYWDGRRWTENVSDRGVPNVDRWPEEFVTVPESAPVATALPAVPLYVTDAPQRPPWYRRPRVVIAIVALLLLLRLIVAAATEEESAEPPTTPAPPYSGALLGLERPETGSHIVTELRSGGEPTERGTLWGSTIAGLENFWVSPDGTRAVSESGTVTLFGPDPPMDLSLGQVKEATFSPDGNRIAYTPDEGGKVHIFDIGTRATADVLQTPCESYGIFPVMSSVCGEADRAYWLDGESLLVWHFAGAMPTKVDCLGVGIASDCQEPGANTFSVVSTSGTILVSVASDILPLSVRGSTVLLNGARWADVAELRMGVLAPKPLPAGAIPSSLSPDGSRIVVPGQPWSVVDLRSGAATPLGTTETIEVDEPSSFWSPDGQFLAIQDERDVLVVPMSEAVGGWIGLRDFELIGWGT